VARSDRTSCSRSFYRTIRNLHVFVVSWLRSVGIVCGIIRGAGLQRYGALISLSGNYLIGIPLAVVFALPFGLNLGGIGLFVGLTISRATQTVVYRVLLSRTDFEAIAGLVKERTQRVENGYTPLAGGEVGKRDFSEIEIGRVGQCHMHDHERENASLESRLSDLR